MRRAGAARLGEAGSLEPPGTPDAGGAGKVGPVEMATPPAGRRIGAPEAGAAVADAELQALVGRLLELIGEDPARSGLTATPRRVAQALRWLTRGYALDVEDAIGAGLFEESHDSMVLVKDVEVYSLCEHHMLPFFGRAHVAYVPDGRILGLSKIARIVDLFARRLQVQERLTDQIADAVVAAIDPKGVAVVVEASHLCMMMRGVEKQNSRTLTSAMRGVFEECRMRREEFLRLVSS